jgi:hypothetical protein
MSEPAASGEASLRAVRRFHTFLAELERQWKYGAPEWQNVRFWAIDADGNAVKIPAAGIELPPDFPDQDVLYKDTKTFAAAIWIKRHRPDAVIVASESWMYPFSAEQGPALRAIRMRHRGRTPSLMDPANRQQLREAGIRVFETLFFYGELRGHPFTFRRFRVRKRGLERWGADQTASDFTEFESIFSGILDGEPQVITRGRYRWAE